MAFAVAGVEFEDVRVSMEEWSAKLKHCEYTPVCWLILHNSIVYIDLKGEKFS